MTRTLMVALLALAALLSENAGAQNYAGRTITEIVNYPAGGPTDIEGRIVAQHLPDHLAGHPTVIVKNMGGAAGLIGANALFPNPGDRGPEAADPSIIARFVAVLTSILRSLANA